MTDAVEPTVGPAGIRANIAYYQALKRKAAEDFKAANKELKKWEKLLSQQ